MLMIIIDSILLPSFAVPARPEQLRLVRATARLVIAHHNPTPDDLADIVLAVDEAANTLLAHAHPSSHVTCIFDLDAVGSLLVHLSPTTQTPTVMHTTSWTSLVLQPLLDHATLKHIP